MNARTAKRIEFRLPEPFDHIEIDMMPVTYSGEDKPRYYSIGVMDRDQGKGFRYSIEYAEAMARGILKAVRAHKRRETRKAGVTS